MSDMQKDPDATMALVEEHLTVERRQVETGHVRVRLATDSETVDAGASLFDHGVDIKHVPIGREVSKVPAIRQDGETTIIPVLEEILVVEKRLVLIEEIHVRQTTKQTDVKQPINVRRQRAEIVRTVASDKTEEG